MSSKTNVLESFPKSVGDLVRIDWFGEALRFVPIGIGAVAIDFFVYFGALFAGAGIGVAKAIGFLSGSLLSYWGNRQFTFRRGGKTPGHIFVFAAIYTISMIANILINSGMVMIAPGSSLMLIAAFLIATLFSATFNFVGLKKLVFVGEQQA